MFDRLPPRRCVLPCHTIPRVAALRATLSAPSTHASRADCGGRPIAMSTTVLHTLTKPTADAKVGLTLQSVPRGAASRPCWTASRPTFRACLQHPRVLAVDYGSIAAMSGLRPGDIVVAVRGISVATDTAAADLIRAAEGDLVVEVLRMGERVPPKRKRTPPPKKARSRVSLSSLGLRNLLTSQSSSSRRSSTSSSRSLFDLFNELSRSLFELTCFRRSPLSSTSQPSSESYSATATASTTSRRSKRERDDEDDKRRDDDDVVWQLAS